MKQKNSVSRQRVVELFTALAAIRSPLLRVGKVMDWLEDWFKSRSISYGFDQAGSKFEVGFERGNLISKVIPATTTFKSLLPIKGVEAHVDTVALPPGVNPVNVVVEDQIIRSDGTTILGADDKAGVAAILVALETILEHHLPHGPIQVLFTVGEERSMYGVRELDLDLVKAASMVCVDGLEVGTLWRGCPAKLKYQAIFHGHAGHGAFPEDTLHAGLVAHLALSGALNAGLLGRGNDWGIIRDSALEEAVRQGSPQPLTEVVWHCVSQIATLPPAVFPATNVVPGEAVIEGEFRSFSKQKLEESFEELCGIFERAAQRWQSNNGKHHASVEFTTEYPYEPFILQPEHVLVQDLLAAMSAASIPQPTSDVGPGATHANVFNQRGIPAVVLGMGGRNAHQNSEYVIIAEMVKAAEVLVQYLTAT